MKAIQMRMDAAAKLREAKAIRAKAEAEQRLFSTEETAEFNALVAEYDRMIEQADMLDGFDARMNAGDLTPSGQGRNIHGISGAQAAKFSIGKFIRGMARDDWRDAEIERAHMEGQVEGDATLGGFAVPTETSAEVIEQLKADAAIFSAGARMETMTSDTRIINVITDGPSVSWLGENEEGDDSEVKFGQRRLVARKAAIFIPLSNELLSDAPGIEATIRREIAENMALEIDRVIPYGAGGKQPLGLKNIKGITAVASSVAIGALDFTETRAILKKVVIANGRFTGWMMHPEIWQSYNSLKDSDGHPLLSGNHAQADVNRLHGFPVGQTTQAKESTTGHIWGGNWADVVVGMRNRLEFAVSKEIKFYTDQTVIRAILRMDVVIRHVENMTYKVVTGLAA